MAETNDPGRWVKANRMAEGIADHGMDPLMRAYYARYLPVGTVLLVGLGYAVSNLLFEQEPWPLDLAFGFILVVFGTMVGGLVYVSRWIKPKVSMARSTPLLWLE